MLLSEANVWLNLVGITIPGLMPGVRWICLEMFTYLEAKFGDQVDSVNELRFIVGRFLLETYFVPVIQRPKQFGLLDTTKGSLSQVSGQNLKKICEVLKHIMGQQEYPQDHRWESNLNQVPIVLRLYLFS